MEPMDPICMTRDSINEIYAVFSHCFLFVAFYARRAHRCLIALLGAVVVAERLADLFNRFRIGSAAGGSRTKLIASAGSARGS